MKGNPGRIVPLVASRDEKRSAYHQRNDHQQQAGHSGDGRALVVLSSNRFKPDEFAVLEKVFDQREIDLVAASPNFATEREDFGSLIKAAHENVNLHDVDPSDYDALFFIGGDTHDLNHKNKTNHLRVKQIVADTLEQKSPVVGCSEGASPMYDTQLIDKQEYKDVLRRKAHNTDELEKFANEVCDTIKPKRR